MTEARHALGRAAGWLLVLPLRFVGLAMSAYAAALGRLRPELGAQWREQEGRRSARALATISHTPSSGDPVTLRLAVPNALTQFRASTFSTKEPETLAWIDEFGSSSDVLYDVGANIGLYSIYAALRHRQRVYAFEPSVFNLGLLARNCALNAVTDVIRLVPTPLTAGEGFAPFTLTTCDESGALSAFGVDYGFDGQPLNPVLQYAVWGASLDFLRTISVLPEAPTMLKIDVDGIEDLILAGGTATLTDARLRTVLIEVNESFPRQSEAVRGYLTDAGFVLQYAADAAWLRGSRFEGSGNQIWVRREGVPPANAESRR